MTIYNHTFTHLGGIIAHPNYIENIPKEFDELIITANKIENKMRRSAVLGEIYLSVLQTSSEQLETIARVTRLISNEISNQRKAD